MLFYISINYSSINNTLLAYYDQAQSLQFLQLVKLTNLVYVSLTAIFNIDIHIYEYVHNR